MTEPFEIRLRDHAARHPGAGLGRPSPPDRASTRGSWGATRSTPEAGTAAMDTGGHREEAEITAYEPGRRLATRTGYRAGRPLHGVRVPGRRPRPGQHRPPRRAQRHARRRLAGRVRRAAPRLAVPPQHAARMPRALRRDRTGVPVFGMAPASRPHRAGGPRRTGRALGLGIPVVQGARAQADRPPLDGEVVWADDERFEVRSADALYTFHHSADIALMFHHLFGPKTDTNGAEAAWQQWLSTTLA
ncbi:SRPBCC family protein [Yinghuangia aomiensis]